MTHDDHAQVADLLARLGDGDSKELFRQLLGRRMQDLIDAELTAPIGAAPHERSEARSNQRNDSRPRVLSTPAGDVELRIPSVRFGSFFPGLLEPRRQVDRALLGVIMTAYATGTSTRKVDDLVRALGCESEVSKSTVSADNTAQHRLGGPPQPIRAPGGICPTVCHCRANDIVRHRTVEGRCRRFRRSGPIPTHSPNGCLETRKALLKDPA